MAYISLAYFVLIQAIDLLLLGQRCQSTYVTDLGLSTCEHSGTMYTGYDVYFCCQRTDLCDCTSIGTLVIFQDHLTNGLLLILVYCRSGLGFAVMQSFMDRVKVTSKPGKGTRVLLVKRLSRP